MMPSRMSNIFDPVNLDIDRLLNRSLHWINVPKGQQQTRQRQQMSRKNVQQQQLPKHMKQQQQQTTKMHPMQQQHQTQLQQQVLGKMPQRFRVLIDCTSCNPKLLKTHIKTVNDQKHLVVCTDEQKIKKGGDTSLIGCKNFKRTYTLPKQVDIKKMISCVTPNGQFVVEFPLEEEACSLNIDMVPKIEKTPEGRMMTLRVPIPQSIDPTKVTLMAKDRDVIVRFA